MPNFNDVEYPTEATVGNQRLRRFESRSHELLVPSLSSADLHRSISELAYQLYLKRGGVHGHDLDDWLAAERIVHFQLSQKKFQAGERQFQTRPPIPQFDQINRRTTFTSR